MLKQDNQKEKQIVDTDNMKATPADSNSSQEVKPKTEDNKGTDNQFFGPWYTYKTTHTISINGNPKGFVPNMVEVLYLMKPFEINPVPKSIKK